MTITNETTVREVAVSNPSSVRVFEKLGIDYCCGGGKSLQDVCEAKNIDLGSLLDRLNAAGGISADPDLASWETAPLAKLIQHIVRRHHGYVRDEMPRLITLSEKVVARHGSGNPDLSAVADCVRRLDQDMQTHMLKEEQVLFPHIARMEHELLAGKPLPAAFFGSVKNPVSAMVDDHDAAGALLKRIRMLTNDFTLPEGACPTFRAFFSSLQEFEQDLHRHVHLENNILFPRAVKLEAGAKR
jgi:regulator of cell morphogenesis and NO signaling